MFQLVERLDGLPRHVAMHPCGVLLSDATLLDRTPVEASFAGFPMSQFDKDDVEDLGLLKLDVLGIRMQSAMAHAVAEIKRIDGVEIDLDDEEQVPFDDPATYAVITSAKTLGVFQIESPGQRELVGKSGIESFDDIITDISLFRPGPVKSDMITPYLEGKQGWKTPTYLHDDLRPILGDTQGVVVFHEQVIEMIAQFAGISFAEADEKRRALGDVEGMAETKVWFFPRALGRGYPLPVVERIWKVLEAFASFGFCKAHAAAFALPTYQSAWLKTHWPAHFLAGVLTHDPGMYPKRLILDDARQFGIAVLGLDVNACEKEYVVERVDPRRRRRPRDGIRLALAEVKGINEAEVERIVAARPFHSLTDFWHRARVSRPIVERLVLAGGFDGVYGIGGPASGRCAGAAGSPGATCCSRSPSSTGTPGPSSGPAAAAGWPGAGRRSGSRAGSVAPRQGRRRGRPQQHRPRGPGHASADLERHPLGDAGVWAKAAAQSKATPPPPPVDSVQLALDLGDEPARGRGVRAAGDDRRGADARRAGDPRPRRQPARRRLLRPVPRRARRHPQPRPAHPAQPVRAAGRRGQGRHPDPADPLRAPGDLPDPRRRHRPGRRDVLRGRPGSVRRHACSTPGCWWCAASCAAPATAGSRCGPPAAGSCRRCTRSGSARGSTRCASRWRSSPRASPASAWSARAHGAAESQVQPAGDGPAAVVRPEERGRAATSAAGGMGRRRVLVHSSGFQMSPYADIKPAGEDTKDVARKLWHRSPGSAGMTGRRPRVGSHVGQRAPGQRPHRRGVGGAGARARPGRSLGRQRIVDIGGGTGGFAVRVAELGHRVTVVDPSPDALAALDRRAREVGVDGHRGPGRPGRPVLAGGRLGRRPGDVVLCHGVLEVVDDPAAALATIREVLRPGGTLSLLVAQRHAAVVARAMAGHFPQALALLADAPDASTGRTGRRFTADEVTALLAGAGFEVVSTHGVRVFADLVPGSLLDLEPGAAAALVELERAVAERPEYLPLATQLHVHRAA